MAQQIERKMEACGDCRYYLEYDELEETPPDEDQDEVLTGVCRRYPPQVLLAYPEAVAAHPDVAGATGWCGEFTPKL